MKKIFIREFILSPVKADLIFGLTHSIVSLLITIYIAGFEFSFLFIWGTLAVSEFVMMGIAIPVVYMLSKRMNLAPSA